MRGINQRWYISHEEVEQKAHQQFEIFELQRRQVEKRVAEQEYLEDFRNVGI